MLTSSWLTNFGEIPLGLEFNIERRHHFQTWNQQTSDDDLNSEGYKKYQERLKEIFQEQFGNIQDDLASSINLERLNVLPRTLK